jgi:hypothetical protein
LFSWCERALSLSNNDAGNAHWNTWGSILSRIQSCAWNGGKVCAEPLSVHFVVVGGNHLPAAAVKKIQVSELNLSHTKPRKAIRLSLNDLRTQLVASDT